MEIQRTGVQILETTPHIFSCYYYFLKYPINLKNLVILVTGMLKLVYLLRILVCVFVKFEIRTRALSQLAWRELSINFPPSQHRDLSRIFFSLYKSATVVYVLYRVK